MLVLVDFWISWFDLFVGLIRRLFCVMIVCLFVLVICCYLLFVYSLGCLHLG